MNRFLKSAILSTAVVATVLTPLASASAADRSRQPVVVQPSRDGDLVVAGILGLAVGAIAAGVIAGSDQPVREPIAENPYRNPRPSLDREFFYEEVLPEPEPDVVYYDGDYPPSFEPWSRDWYRYCANEYRSFDAATGTFINSYGEEEFCVAD